MFVKDPDSTNLDPNILYQDACMHLINMIKFILNIQRTYMISNYQSHTSMILVLIHVHYM